MRIPNNPTGEKRNPVKKRRDGFMVAQVSSNRKRERERKGESDGARGRWWVARRLSPRGEGGKKARREVSSLRKVALTRLLRIERDKKGAQREFRGKRGAPFSVVRRGSAAAGELSASSLAAAGESRNGKRKKEKGRRRKKKKKERVVWWWWW